jgi:hypothetical protein
MNRTTLVGAPVAALLLPLVATATTAAASAPATTTTQAKVKVWSGDGMLRKCAGHTYRYAVAAPHGAGDSWALETHLVNRNGRTVAFDYKVMGADPAKGHGKLRFCSEGIRPGRYKVTAELIWSHYSDESHTWAKPRTIRLHRS